MYYLIHKFEHEILIEDIFEGDTLEQAVENAFKERGEGKERDDVLGSFVGEEGINVQSTLDWIKEDNYEFTTIYKSKFEIIRDDEDVKT